MPYDNTKGFGFGSNPPTEGVSNTHDGTSNPNMGEETALDPKIEGNKFPRDKGHVSLSDEEVVLS